MSACSVDGEDHYSPSVRLVELEKPASGSLGFHLTRSKWDPYPWIGGIDPGSAADLAKMRPGDCLLEVNGEDVIGQRVSEVAQLIRAHPNQVSLLLWNAGVDSQCSPEALCCGPMPSNLQKLSACMSSILQFLECPVCLETAISPTYQCDNGHLICMRCRTKSERCPVCRIRFNRGRSLLSDQVYCAIAEAFELRDDSHESRAAKMQQIFKLKSKKAPGVKVTPAHTNKFLARLIGKSSSVDNLSTKNTSCNSLTVDGEFLDTGGLKSKSLSSSEIFSTQSTRISRTGSIYGLNRTNLQNKNQDPNRPVSYHGSYESLDNQITFAVPQIHQGVLFHCPFKLNCSALIKGGELLHHFQNNHDGPMIQYFNPKARISLHALQENDTFVFNFEDHQFYLKIINESERKTIEGYKDILIWLWFLGNKKQSSEYQLHIKLFNKKQEDHILLSVNSAVHSLSSVSWSELSESRKGIYISAETLNAVSTPETMLGVEVIKCDMQL